MSRRKEGECRRANCHRRIDRVGLCAQHYRASTERGYIDSAEVRDHIAALNRAGMSLESIAADAAMSLYGVQLVLTGKRVQKGTADRILRIPLGGDGLVPALASRRRLHALAAIGWPLSTIAPRIGVSPKHISDVFAHERIRADKARRVQAVYEELWNTDGPSDASRRRAQRRGWAPPLAWDDETIDDPAAQPQHDAHRFVSFAELYVEVRHDLDITDVEKIAEKLRQKPESVKQQCHRRRDDIARLEGIAS